VLGSLGLRFPDQQLGFRDAPQGRLVAKAAWVALGPDAGELLDDAVRELRGEPTPEAQAPADSEEDASPLPPVGLRFEEPRPGARRITWVPELIELWTPRAAPALTGLMLLAALATTRRPLEAIICALATLPFCYLWIAVLNRRVIEIDKQTLSLSFRPLPWRGWRCATPEVECLQVEQEEASHGLGRIRPDSLWAVLVSGKRQVLLRGADEWQVHFARDQLDRVRHERAGKA
jgi:hypothetical protein